MIYNLHIDRSGVEQRNSDYQSICDNMQFDFEADNDDGSSSSSSSTSESSSSCNSPVGNNSKNSNNNKIEEKDSGVSQHTAAAEEKKKNASLTIEDHDLIFFFGDFNYRIDSALSSDEVFDLVASSNGMKRLLEHDQLNHNRAAGKCFKGYNEGLLDFPPTYKYKVGSNLYEQRAGKNKRPPAWCDRVLWRWC